MGKGIDLIVVAYRNIDRFIEKNAHILNKYNIKTIIADNGENEICRERIRNINIIPLKHNIGYGAAVNRAIEHSDAPFCIVSNDDIVFGDNFFENLRQYILNMDRKTAIAGFNIISEKTNSRGIHKYVYSIPHILYHFSILPRIFSLFSQCNGYIGGFETMHYHKSSKFVKGVSGSCFLVRRELFNRLKGFDEAFFLTYEETELYRRILKNGYRIAYRSDCIVLHKHGFSASGISLKESYRSMHIYLQKHYNVFFVHFTEYWVFTWLVLKRILLLNRGNNEIRFFLLR